MYEINLTWIELHLMHKHTDAFPPSISQEHFQLRISQFVVLMDLNFTTIRPHRISLWLYPYINLGFFPLYFRCINELYFAHTHIILLFLPKTCPLSYFIDFFFWLWAQAYIKTAVYRCPLCIESYASINLGFWWISLFDY